MTFQEAKEKANELANGKYHAVRYELTENSCGELKSECSVYIDGEGFFYGSTFENMFDVRSAKICPVLQPMPEELEIAA